MRFFEELGARVDDAWKIEDYDEAAFPEVATRCLEELRPSDHLGMMDIIRWAHSPRSFSRRGGFDTKFGQPPINVFRATRFHIDTLFWAESTTSIHQHDFSGAFHVLDGSSLHSRYDFEAAKRYNDRLLLGRLSLRDVERLEKGATRPIHAGSETIHALFHLDHPSISVVVRTPACATRSPQLSYRRPGIAYDPFYTNESLYLRQQTLKLLHGLNHPEFYETALRAIRDADALDAFVLMQDLSTTLAPDEFDALLRDVAPSHEELTQYVRAAAKSRRCERNTIALRTKVHQRDHRYFLALMMNVQSRDEVFKLVGEAYPGMSPVDRIVSWAQELTAITAVDPATGEKVSPPYAGKAFVVLRHLLSGATVLQVLARMRGELEENTLLALCRTFQTSPLFEGILGPSESAATATRSQPGLSAAPAPAVDSQLRSRRPTLLGVRDENPLAG